jgi:tRNA(fMet)-specific endonuclease VapC
MDPLVLDTNIVSFRLRADTRAELYEPHCHGKILCISFMSLAEMYEGAERKKWSAMRLATFEDDIRKYLIVPYSVQTCRVWGRLRAERKSRPISVDDAWIAATALVHGCPLATHNPADFAGITGLRVLTESQ